MSRRIAVETVLTASGVPLRAEWRYDTSDPYAVGLVIRDGDVTLTWEFARDLLDVGMISNVAMGAGDVRVWACESEELHIHLINPLGQSTLTLDLGDAVDFIEAAYEAVPEGLEHEYADIDGELSEIFGRAA